MSRILITGASGLLGTRLTQLLLERGHTVSHLGRSKRPGSIPSFTWDAEAGTMEPEALQNIDAVIHLAGAGIADEAWSAKRKKEILESRTKSTALLVKELNKAGNQVKVLVSGSAIGFYGMTLSDILFTENDKPGADFLAEVVKAWEHEADQLTAKRLVKIRTGVVLSRNDGALKEIAQPVRYGFGAPLGTGRQYVSWIHIDDICTMFIKAVEDESMHGAYNGVTGAVTNRELTKAIAKTLRKPLWLPAVPAFALKLFLGEMSYLVLYGSNVSSAKIRQAGFAFKFDNLGDALADLLH
ncbi:MAG: TIGR01777 family oxidoreductase [Cyclobacteriaceae bacterium]